MRPFELEDLSRLQTHSLKQRSSLSTRDKMGTPLLPSDSVGAFIKSLPVSYMASELCDVAKQMAQCHKYGHRIHFSMGSHVIKNGLSRYLIDWMKRGFINTLSFNGSALVHDFELAFCGHTSENVDESIDKGQFGLARETSEFIHEAISKSKEGLGYTIGNAILKNTEFSHESVLAQAVQLGIPATVHVAIGTDIVHLHPQFNPESTAKASYVDFLAFIRSISQIENGMYFNVGSAVILPEVFLKALSVARNLGYPIVNFWAVNLDFIRQYRPQKNVLERPTRMGGRAVEIIGPHEIVLPLLHAASLHFAQDE